MVPRGCHHDSVLMGAFQWVLSNWIRPKPGRTMTRFLADNDDQLAFETHGRAERDHGDLIPGRCTVSGPI